MAIGQNKVVSMNYTLKDKEGNVIQTTDKREPFQYLSGNQQILPNLEKEIDNMIIGSKKNVKIPAKDAYGEYNEQAVQQIDKKTFPDDIELQVGMEFVANSPEGQQMPFVVTDIKEQEVTVDFNHPLAGRDLEFDVELLDVRDATLEEMKHGHAHGPNGHHHH
ncbi:MAG: peptidylprolyl isomerase [Ignavibacteriales bacterium]|nr:MAG: peptidylprolyl isomerase [Ignavibacteriales bacterium]